MQVFGVTGDGSRTLVDRLVDRLDGRVAVVRDARGDGGVVRGRADTTYERAGEGWRATGVDGSLDEVLDRLAPDHDYAVVEAFPDARLPQVALGDATVADPLLSAPDAASVDVDALVEAVDALEPRETLASLVSRVEATPGAERAGAVATFTGRVRAKDHEDDAPTEYLEFEKYEGVADERMARIESELTARDGVEAVALHHRTGVVEAGEDIVFVVVLAGHRDEAFRAVQDGIDRLKDEVPLFKKEVTADETFWVHDRARDDAPDQE